MVLKREPKSPETQGELLLSLAEIAKYLPLSFVAKQANGQCLSIQGLPMGSSASENFQEGTFQGLLPLTRLSISAQGL